jgi:site-specific DNA-methyltransferase (adenine-specific)
MTARRAKATGPAAAPQVPAPYLDAITAADCLELLPQLPAESIDCLLTDPPYGISLDEWDVLHDNTNSALLGQSPAQVGKSAFRRRGKPINGWRAADREIPREYQAFMERFARAAFPALKPGASAFLFGARRTVHRAIVAMEDAGFLLRDVLAWEKPAAHHRAQRLSVVLERRGLAKEAAAWEGFRLGNLAPRWEPVAWFFKPYRHTITDNILRHGVGALAIDRAGALALGDGKRATNLLRCGFSPQHGDGAKRVHEAQKPVRLLEFLLELVTLPGQVVVDPFAGSGSTAVACVRTGRHFVSCERLPAYVQAARERLAGALADRAAPEAAAGSRSGRKIGARSRTQPA